MQTMPTYPSLEEVLQETERNLTPAQRKECRDAIEPLKQFQQNSLRFYPRAVVEVVEAAVADSPNFIHTPLMKYVDALITGLKEKVNDQLSEIMHAPDFQELERTHQTIEKLLFDPENTRTKYRLLNVSRDDLRNDHAEANGVPEQMKAYWSMCRDEFHRPGGRPNKKYLLGGTITIGDLPLYQTLTKIARENCAILGVQLDPSIVCMPDPSADGPPTDFRTLSTDPKQIGAGLERDENQSLIDWEHTDDATNAVQSTVRALGRQPYDPLNNPALGAPYFAERIDRHEDYLWIPQTVLLTKRLAVSYSVSDTPSDIIGIHSGGKELIPTHVREGDKVQFEVLIDDKTEPQLSKRGTIAFVPWKYKNFAVLFDAQTAFVSTPSGDEKIDAEVALAGRLQYVMLKHMMGHILKAKLREAIGQKLDEQGIAELLEAEFLRFVTPDARSVKDQAALSRKPFKMVKITVKQTGPGCYTAHAEMVPHVALCFMDLTLKVAAEVSPAKP